MSRANENEVYNLSTYLLLETPRVSASWPKCELIKSLISGRPFVPVSIYRRIV
jgi:hypothetical protein